MAEFHFLRPWWLLALPAGFVLVWALARGGVARSAWRKVVDGALQPHVLTRAGVLRQRRLPMIAALTVWTLATVALAGPAWERLPVPALRDDDALVVVFDLSRSMDATDLEPSRLAQARLKLLALLERRPGGQTALVVFSAHAFTVTPLTTDNRTIAALVNALTTDIMPTQGSVPEAGLERAVQLLRQTGLTRGEILLMTDAIPEQRTFETARASTQEGYRVHVLAIGTEQGAPVALAGGGFLTDAAGRVVVPAIDTGALRRLAAAGGGRFAVLSPDETDLDTLLTTGAAAGTGAAAAGPGEDFLADVWQDRGPWLVLLLLPFLALGFRRGWIAVLAVCVALPGAPAHAFEWSSLWERSDRRALRALEEDDPARAAELFEDREWRAAAQYRAEDYLASAATLEALDSARAHYNRGNALARAGSLPAAIAAYDSALELDPTHEDARYNRDLLEELLRENPQLAMPPSAGDDGGESQDGDQQGEGGPREGSGQQEERLGAEGSQSDPSAPDDNSAGEQGGEAADTGDEEGLDPAQADSSGAGDGGDRPGDGSDETLGPDDIEQWASEQAVEQWLRRIPQDPGGLLRRKFQYQYQRLGLDQDGNYIGRGDELEPW